MKIFVFILIFLLSACIKEEGKIPASAAPGPTTGGTSGGVPNTPDPLASYAWHIENTGQSSFSESSGISGQDINLTEALEQNVTGKGVRIAVSDSGTDIDHSDLNQNALVGEHRHYGSKNSSNWHGRIPYPTGDDAHGTAVAGLIAATGFNGLGSRGVAFDAQFAAFKFLINYNSSFTETSLLARAVDQTDGDFDIFNYSYGYSDCIYFEEDESILEAIKTGVSELRDGKGAIYIQAAGNGRLGDLDTCLDDEAIVTGLKYAHNTNFSSDLSTPHKIIVGALNARGVASTYSSPGSGIWVSAPGGEDGEDEPAMITTDISGCMEGYSQSYSSDHFNRGVNPLNKYCDYTSLMNGTSAATPIVSGVVALMLEAEPNLSWRDVKHILATTADVIDPVNAVTPHPFELELTGYQYDYKWQQNAAEFFFSNKYGFGRVNANKAVEEASRYDFPLGDYEETINPNSGVWYYSSGSINDVIPDNNKNGVEATIEVAHNFFVESVQIKLNITHGMPSDLGVHLKSPSGPIESRLLNINSNVYAFEFPQDKILMTNAFYGENSIGTWTLKIVDASGGDIGSLVNWSINIHGHRIHSDGPEPNPASGITMASNYPSRTYSPNVTYTPSISSNVVRYEVSVGSTAGASDMAKWYSIGTATTFQVGGMRLTANRNYYLNIRAIDDEENVSSVVSKLWRTY